MALVTCPDCGAELSSAAPTCVRCGRPMVAPKSAFLDPAANARSCLTVGCGLLVVGLLAVIAFTLVAR